VNSATTVKTSYSVTVILYYSSTILQLSTPYTDPYNVVRQRYFNVSSLHELFDTVNAQNILGFIREILGFIVFCNLTYLFIYSIPSLLLLFLNLL